MSDDDDRDERDLWRRYAAGRRGLPARTGCPDEATLAAFLDGGMAEAERARLETHLAGCARCLAAAEEARTIEGAPLAAVSDPRRERLVHAVVAQQRGESRRRAWLPLAAALVFACGTGFWLGARAAADAAAVRSGGSGSSLGLESFPVVSVP